MLLQQTRLFAETRMSEIQGRYQGKVVAEDSSMLAIIVFVAAAAIGAALIYFLFVCRPVIEDSPCGLLNELCYAHEIHGTAQRLINEIAEATTLPHPAVMFLSKDNFEKVLESAHSKLVWNDKKRQDLVRLRQQLFAT